MTSVRELLAAILAMPIAAPLRVLNLCGDHERLISLSGMRDALGDRVRLLSGPGSAASLCPQADLYQAIQLASRQPLTLLVAEGLMHLPLAPGMPGVQTLAQAALAGADVRPVGAPVEALLAARAEPQREMVLFIAGFETLLAPLAGMVLDGLPGNLSVLVCGRRVEPLLDELLARGEAGFEALLLPGNRCAVTGTAAWERLALDHRLPAAVAGYTIPSVLTALHGLLRQHLEGTARVDNCYRGLVRHEGYALSRARLEQVFEPAEGRWRGVGSVRASAFRLRPDYRSLDADHRYPDYRGDLPQGLSDMPAGCQCAAVLLGRRAPSDCMHFATACRAIAPYGPCMASDDGTCHLQSVLAAAA